MKFFNCLSFQNLNTLLDSPDQRECEQLDILIELSENEIPKVRRIFEVYGQKAKILNWNNWSKSNVSASDIISLLNLLPALENLHFSSYNTPFVGEAAENSINLPNLKSLEVSDCDKFVLEFFAKSLPDNSIQKFKLVRAQQSDAHFNDFIAKQKSITDLDITGMDFKTFTAVQELKLKNLRAVILKDDEKHRYVKFEFYNELWRSF